MWRWSSVGHTVADWTRNATSSRTRRLGSTMIGLAPVALVAAAGAAVYAVDLDAARPGWALAARALASVAAVLFAGGYGLVMRARAKPSEHRAATACRRVSVAALGAAAVITAWQLVVVNDTVAPAHRAALWALVVLGILSGAGALMAPRLLGDRDP